MTESASALTERAKPKAQARPIYRYDIPSPLAAAGVSKVGLVQLTSSEELQATKRARNDTHRLAYELAKQSLVEVNGDRVSSADGSVDTAWDQMPPKVRTLVMTAYGNLHAPEEADIDAFLKSQRVDVG